MQIASCYSEEKISQMSHGFRGNRDVPTAIQEVQQRIISELLPIIKKSKKESRISFRISDIFYIAEIV